MHFVIAEPTSTEACQMMWQLTPFLEPAIEESHNEMDIQDLFAMVLRDEAKVWLVFERDSRKLRGVAVTSEVEYPHHANLRVMFMGGQGMMDWQDQLDHAFCVYCEKVHLANVEVVGRSGFARRLKALGYEQAYTVLLEERSQLGKSAGTNKTVASTTPASFQQPYIDTLLEKSKGLLDTGGPQYYPDQTVASTTDATVQGQQFLGDKAVANAQLNDNYIQPAIRTGLNSYDVANNPVVNDMANAVTQPVIQQLQEQVLPGIKSGAVASGTLGGSRQGIAEGQGIGRASQEAMNARAGVYNNAYGQGLNLLSNTLAQTPSLQTAAYEPGKVLSAVGDQQQQQRQAEINAAIAKWDYNQQLPYAALTEYGNQVSKPFGGNAVSEVSATGNGTAQTIGSILSGLGLGTEIWKILFPSTP